jgi:hypothetical protein
MKTPKKNLDSMGAKCVVFIRKKLVMCDKNTYVVMLIMDKT